MRVFKLSDGSSWVARLHDGAAEDSDVTSRVGWEAVVFEKDPGEVAQRLVYRPAGWLAAATPAELAAALEEGVVVRTRWTG
jgi:hypothetical protein